VRSFIDQVTDQLNLRWAWEKVRREAAPGDVWFDEVELAGFELELEQNLQSIAAEVRRGRYRLKPLRPLPYPKDPDKQGNPRIRQMFQVSIRDQVAWVAVVNVVGPYVDSKMPTWSYGHRLFRSIWVEEDADGIKRPRIGRYRHAAGRIYLPFGQSWPIFRRHVYLATRAMTQLRALPELDDEKTEEELNRQKQLPMEHRCPFVMPEYWQDLRPPQTEEKLYWCSVDLEQFYPTFNLRTIRENIVGELPVDWRKDADRLVRSMLVFRLDMREWSDEELEKINLRPSMRTFRHIPTGLYVAGFLANAGLLKVDHRVTEYLKDHGIAHFRFVDDHILLAYSFESLNQWVHEYTRLLREERTGAHVNPTKVEPEELAELLTAKQQGAREAKYRALVEKADKACCLDPRFPSPLMTKTLALVSGIARMDFNLLESDELAALTDQLEHLLLVDLPAEEMAKKTRLSFAATRLTRVAECRLANAENRVRLCHRQHKLRELLTAEKINNQRRDKLQRELKDVEKELNEETEKIELELYRALQLLRKVLRERPDRVRLWSRAVLMCRLTGVKGLRGIFEDINKDRGSNPLSAEYLQAITLMFLGDQVLVAARIVRDESTAPWRRQAARSFLEDVGTSEIEPPINQNDRWFLRMSWCQFCFGMWCADLVLRDRSPLGDALPEVSLPEGQLRIGQKCLQRATMGHSPARWAWWAGRVTLRDLDCHANHLVKLLGKELKPSEEANAFWRFFPPDAPTPALRRLAEVGHLPKKSARIAGWWFDALRHKKIEEVSLLPSKASRIPGSVRRVLAMTRRDTVSLYAWCDYLRRLSGEQFADPRNGEWTALEIVRQVALLLSKVPTLQLSYIRKAKRLVDHLPYVHPANFRIPTKWLQVEDPPWDTWRTLIRPGKKRTSVTYVPASDRIKDNRYTPLGPESPLFMTVNPVRGLGLLLYGLLKKSFDLPTMWNGPGHADVLAMLPRLLLKEMTCSSWTLGILAGCLQPRVTENLILKMHRLPGYTFDEDTLHDPVAFRSAQEVCEAIEICQGILERYQLSTLNHKARQLTPVSILQLTRPEWNVVFRFSTGEEGT
jgi:hypothetical protein